MLDFAEKLHEELLVKLELLDHRHDPKDGAADERLELLNALIGQLKNRLVHYVFENEQEEIYFFKQLLPRFLSLYIYYSEKRALECSCRIGTEKSRQEFLEMEGQKIDYFFRANSEFFNYYRFGKTTFDRYYFLRNQTADAESLDMPIFLLDASFCTIHSWKISIIMAYCRLERDIRLSWNENRGADESSVEKMKAEADPGGKMTRLIWTDIKTGMIELIYSLQEQGAFNNGQADLKTIIYWFEIFFSVELGNTSSTYQQLLSRKKGSASFLNRLREKFEQRIEKIEEQNLRAR